MKIRLDLVFLAMAIVSAYWLGRAQAEVKIIKEQVEVVRYVEKQVRQIRSRPNTGRDELLRRMHDNKL